MENIQLQHSVAEVRVRLCLVDSLHMAGNVTKFNIMFNSGIRSYYSNKISKKILKYCFTYGK